MAVTHSLANDSSQDRGIKLDHFIEPFTCLLPFAGPEHLEPGRRAFCFNVFGVDFKGSLEGKLGGAICEVGIYDAERALGDKNIAETGEGRCAVGIKIDGFAEEAGNRIEISM